MLTVRHIQTTTDEHGAVIPVLDSKRREVVLWSVAIPREIEAKGPAAIDAYVATSHQADANTETAERVPVVSPAPSSEDVTHG